MVTVVTIADEESIGLLVVFRDLGRFRRANSVHRGGLLAYLVLTSHADANIEPILSLVGKMLLTLLLLSAKPRAKRIMQYSGMCAP